MTSHDLTPFSYDVTSQQADLGDGSVAKVSNATLEMLKLKRKKSKGTLR